MKLARRFLVFLVVIGLAAAYAVVGLFDVAPDEQAVVLRMGSYARTLGPGQFHWHALLLERVEKRRVTTTIREEFGYRTISSGPPPEYEDRPDEKRMLTGDLNLVDVEFVLQYRIDDLRSYLFKVESVPATIRDAAQAVVRESVATRPIDDVLTEAKGPIQLEAKERIQDLLDAYGAGVRILTVRLQEVEPPEPVKDAFADVTSAEQDRERLILEARGYADAVLPRARGEAQEMLNQASAHKQRRVLTARGEADRFTALLTEYKKAPNVTRERLYLETLERILPTMEKVIIEEDRGDRVLPYLPLGKRGRVE